MTLTSPARTLVPLLVLAALAACAPTATTPDATPGPAAERIADSPTAEAVLAVRVPVEVEFVTDEAGAVSLVAYQGDQEIRGHRVSP